jgi:selenocysteine lyase/cysteine desulfurase
MEVADFLSKKGIAVRAGLHCSPLAHQSIGTLEIGTVRVSPSFFNNKSDIYALIDAVNSIKKQKNIRKNY